MQLRFLSENLWCISAQNMTAGALDKAYSQMRYEELDRVVFYDGSITNSESFTAFALGEGVETRFVYHNKELCGFVWLNNPLGLACMVHFCLFRPYFIYQREIGFWVLKQYLKPINPQTGEVYIKALYGITPKVYRHTLDFIKSIGFRILGEIPGACEFKCSGKPTFRSGVASVVTLADLK